MQTFLMSVDKKPRPRFVANPRGWFERRLDPFATGMMYSPPHERPCRRRQPGDGASRSLEAAHPSDLPQAPLLCLDQKDPDVTQIQIEAGSSLLHYSLREPDTRS